MWWWGQSLQGLPGGLESPSNSAPCSDCICDLPTYRVLPFLCLLTCWLDFRQHLPPAALGRSLGPLGAWIWASILHIWVLVRLDRGPPRGQIARERRQLGFLSSCGFFLKYAGISKSLESVLSLGPRPTGGGSSPPELRHARTGPQGPPGRSPRLPMAASSSQPPRERPPWPKREFPHSHPVGAPGASKATIPSGGPLSDPELQRRVMEVRSP